MNKTKDSMFLTFCQKAETSHSMSLARYLTYMSQTTDCPYTATLFNYPGSNDSWGRTSLIVHLKGENDGRRNHGKPPYKRVQCWTYDIVFEYDIDDEEGGWL